MSYLRYPCSHCVHLYQFLCRPEGYYATRYGLSDRTDASGLQDPRLDLLRTEWFEGKRCLDVGCNEGDLTLALVLRFRPCRMVGLDIDGKLVDRARKVIFLGMLVRSLGLIMLTWIVSIHGYPCSFASPRPSSEGSSFSMKVSQEAGEATT